MTPVNGFEHLFPDTYELDRAGHRHLDPEADDLAVQQVAREIGLEAGPSSSSTSPYDVVVVASIIEREAGRAEDRAKIARVLYNRLDKGEKLQLDSTVAYAEKLNTVTTTPKQRDSDSPYNTYKHEGLPPGPISAPGQAALQAAMEPADRQVAVLRRGEPRHRRDQVRRDLRRAQQERARVPGLVPGEQGQVHVIVRSLRDPLAALFHPLRARKPVEWPTTRALRLSGPQMLLRSLGAPRQARRTYSRQFR